VQHLVGELNRLYRTEPALHELDFAHEGFQWLEPNDHEQSVVAFLRRSRAGEAVLVVCNMTPVPRQNYCVGVPHGGDWEEVLNSDATPFGAPAGATSARCAPHRCARTVRRSRCA